MRLTRFEIQERLCRRCGACMDACPREAIAVQPDRSLSIDQQRCDQCGMCQASCKLRAIAKRRGLFFD